MKKTMWVPFVAMFLSAGLTYVAVPALMQRDLAVSPGGDPRASLVLLAAVALGTAWKPVLTLDMLVGMYVPIYIVAALGWIGNAILPYLMLAFAMTLVANRAVRNLANSLPTSNSGSVIPGAFLIAGLAFLSFVQWFRAADMRDSAFRVCDMVGLCLLLNELPKWDGKSLREATQSFILGVAGTCVVLLNAELFKTDRLGGLIHFNSDFIGYATGAALLMATPKMVFAEKRWVYVLVIPILVTTLYFSGCRGALYGAMATIPFVLWYDYGLPSLFIIGSMASVASYVTVEGMKSGSGLAFRMISPFVESVFESSSRRDRIWRALWEQRDQYWITGVGIHNAGRITGQAGLFADGNALATHNIYLTFLVELGILGLVLFLAWQCWTLWFGFKHRSEMVLLLPVSLYFAVEGFFSGFANISLVAVMMAIGFGLRQRRAAVSSVARDAPYAGRIRNGRPREIVATRSM